MAITPLPTPPQRSDPTNFPVRADAFMTALPTFATEVSAAQVDITTKQAQTAANAVSAAAGAATAMAGANFKGNWSSLTGSLSIPASVLYGNQYWILLSNLTDVTTATPGVSAAWVLYSAAPWLRKTAAYTAAVGDRIKASTTAGGWSLTMPASPNDGDSVEVLDVDGAFNTNNLTVLANNGKKVMGNTVSWVLDTMNFHPIFYYDATNGDWRI